MNPVPVMVPDNLPEEDTADMAAALAMEEIAQAGIEKHMGPDDHPSGSSQLAHGGGPNAKKDKVTFWVDVLRFRRNRDGTFGTASYGPYSTRELAESAIRQMNTKRFKAVVGERAERDLARPYSPRDYNALTNDIGRRSLTVYHGTKSEARLAGDFSVATKDGPYMLFGPGYYFTLEEGRAAAYGSVMTVKLDNVRLYETPLYDDYRMGDVAARAGVLDRLKQKKLDATADNIIAEFQSMGYDGLLLGEKENYSRWPEQVVIWDHRLINIAKHMGPGPHPSGSPQSVHAGKGKKFRAARVREFIEPFKRHSFYGTILDHGTDYKGPTKERNAELMAEYGIEKIAAGNCFTVAREVMFRSPSTELFYVEGFAMPPSTMFPVHHAWLVTENGEVIDPTWRGQIIHKSPLGPGVEYLGIMFDADYVRRRAMKTKVWGMFQGFGDDPEPEDFM